MTTAGLSAGDAMPSAHGTFASEGIEELYICWYMNMN